MNYDVEITALKTKVDALEEDINLLYEFFNARIEDMHTIRSQRIAIWSIVVAIIIGGIQIAIALFNK
ncbi:MAG: hypothetical protein IJT58_08295 [Synergistaceae bacterium]|nr:hypothetical protein [Synergistaceae bacterium]